jgi:hypothetical protein
VQSRPLFALRQGHLVRLRHARRSGHGQRPAGTAVHLPLIGRRHTPHVRVIEGRGEAPTTQELFIESIRARERAALADLGAAAGGRSLCSLSRAGASVPTVKYDEGAVAALADARRAVQAAAYGPDGVRVARTSLLDVRAQWRAQSETVGRTGPAWAGYLAGGLDALDQIVDDDEGRGACDA